MHVLITGGAGFIGSHLADALIDRGCNVTLYDSIEPQVHGKKAPAYLPKKAKLVRGLMTDGAKLKRVASQAHVIFHFAAAVGVGQSQYEIERYVRSNLMGTGVLLDVLVDKKVRRRLDKILVAGSMSAYGEGAYDCRLCGRVRPPLRRAFKPTHGSWDPLCPGCGEKPRPTPTKESDAFVCTSIYAVTKASQEDLVLNFGAAYGVPAVALRFFNVYGPRQSLSNPYTGVAAIFISRVKNGHPTVIYEDGGQMRDFVSVHDIVQGCVRAMQTKSALGPYNIGTGGPTTVRSLAEQISALFKSSTEPQTMQQFRAGDVRHCWADISRARAELGYRPQVSLRDGLRELIDWAKDAWAEDKFDRAHQELVARGLLTK